MGVLNDFKKLFWAKKAVAKSTARKVGQEAKELAEEGLDKAKDFGEKVVHKAEDAFDDARDYASELMDDVWKKDAQASTTPPPPQDPAPDTMDTPKTTGTGHRESVVDKAVEMSDKVWEKAEEVGDKFAEKSGVYVDKAKDLVKKAGEKVEGKIDEMLEKAKELDKKIEAERDAIDKNRDGFADKPLNEKLREKKSLLDDKDDFWAKADQYSKGDYSMGKPTVVKPEASADDKLELKPLKGFKDNDGDGDSLVDDAEIVDDDDKDPDDKV